MRGVDRKSLIGPKYNENEFFSSYKDETKIHFKKDCLIIVLILSH